VTPILPEAHDHDRDGPYHAGRPDDSPQGARGWPGEPVGLTRDGLRAALIEAGTPEKQAKMRAGQIWQWVYQKGVRDFGAMTNLAKAYRAELEASVRDPCPRSCPNR
jgi:hypothetical protein